MAMGTVMVAMGTVMVVTATVEMVGETAAENRLDKIAINIIIIL